MSCLLRTCRSMGCAASTSRWFVMSSSRIDLGRACKRHEQVRYARAVWSGRPNSGARQLAVLTNVRSEPRFWRRAPEP
jgi:hypothetical protein